jgi:hypothetical protein
MSFTSGDATAGTIGTSQAELRFNLDEYRFRGWEERQEKSVVIMSEAGMQSHVIPWTATFVAKQWFVG